MRSAKSLSPGDDGGCWNLSFFDIPESRPLKAAASFANAVAQALAGALAGYLPRGQYQSLV